MDVPDVIVMTEVFGTFPEIVAPVIVGLESVELTAVSEEMVVVASVALPDTARSPPIVCVLVAP